MLNMRASGILLHPTSLPGRFGAGDLGEDAYRFVDWLKSAGQTYWQMLPLGEIGPGYSPYMSKSAFAGNVLLIDLHELAKYGWLDKNDLEPLPEFSAGRIDFALMQPFRMERLRRAANNFFSSNNEIRLEYEEFCKDEKGWLEDYALFMAIAEHHNQQEWSFWPAELVRRDDQALSRAKKEYAEEVSFWKFCQWRFAHQWFRLKEYANSHGIWIIGDVLIFVAYQCADVWAHQELFKLDENGPPWWLAGCRPIISARQGSYGEIPSTAGKPTKRQALHGGWRVCGMRYTLPTSYASTISGDFQPIGRYPQMLPTPSTENGGQFMEIS